MKGNPYSAERAWPWYNFLSCSNCDLLEGCKLPDRLKGFCLVQCLGFSTSPNLFFLNYFRCICFMCMSLCLPVPGTFRVWKSVSELLELELEPVASWTWVLSRTASAEPSLWSQHLTKYWHSRCSVHVWVANQRIYGHPQDSRQITEVISDKSSLSSHFLQCDSLSSC